MKKSYLPSYEKLVSRRVLNIIVFFIPALAYYYLTDSNDFSISYLCILFSLGILSMVAYDLLVYVSRIKDILEDKK